MLAQVRSVWRDCTGTTAVEVALIASLISVAAIAGYKSLGGSVGNQFTHIENNLPASPGGNP